MATTIVSQTLGGVVDKRIGMSKSHIARPHALGTSWNVLRVGIRCQIAGMASNIPGGYIFIGLSAGTASPFGAQTTTNAFGLYHGDLEWIFSAAGVGVMPRYANGNSSWTHTAKNIGGTITKSAGINDGDTMYWSADPTTATRRVLFVDIIKGSPNYSINFFYSNSGSDSLDVLQSDFITQFPNTTPSFTGHKFVTSAGALAFDQSAGTLDCVNVTWALPGNILHVCDIAAKVIS